MLRLLTPRGGPAVLVGLALAMTPCVVAVAATPPAADKDASPAAKIKQQLDQTVTIESADQSLNAAINQIREQTKINFVMDRNNIQQLGMDPEQILVTVKLKDVKARTALRAVLAPYSLGYAIINDTVLVSTDDLAVYRQMHQRVNIDCNKVSLGDALKKLSRETAANILFDPRVTGKESKAEVNLQMEDVPLETGVRLMAEMAGLKPVRVGNVLFVTTKTHANEIRADEQQNQPGQPQAGIAIDFGGPAPQLPPPDPHLGQPPPTPAPPDKVDPDKPTDKAAKTEPAKPDGKDPKPDPLADPLAKPDKP